jgi:RHS repeat-associated protein
MRKSLVVWFLTLSVASAAVACPCSEGDWAATSTSVNYVITCPYTGPSYTCNYYQMGVSYSGGQWSRWYYEGKPGYYCQLGIIPWCTGWTPGSCNPCASKCEGFSCQKFLQAKELLDSGWVEEYLNLYWPQGGTDPDFETIIQYTFAFADATIPPVASAYANDTNPARGGEPVYLSNGEYGLSVTDLSVVGRALPVRITRTYGSRRECNARFGYGWDMSYNIKVRRLAAEPGEPNVVMLIDGKGARRQYTQDAVDPNLYVNLSDLKDYLYDTNDLLTLVKKSGIEYEFDGNGNLAAITDENGNSISFLYDPNGPLPIYGPSRFFHVEVVPTQYDIVARDYKLDTIVDDLGRQISFTYDSAGLLSTITDFAGRTWTYTYDSGTNNLLAVEDPNGGVTTYCYDYRHNLTVISDPNGQTYMQNTYAEGTNDLVSEQTYGYGKYLYDYNSVEQYAVVKDREGYDTKTAYNAAGQIVSETVYAADPQAEPNSFTTSHLYDPDMSEPVRTIYPDGTCMDYQYDDHTNVIGIYRKTEPDDPNSASDPNVIATTFTYDTTHIYDINSITDPMGNTTYFEFDPNGNVIQITYPAVPVYGYAQPQTPIVHYTYNGHGQVDTMTSADGIVTKYLYYSDAYPNDPNCGKLWKTIVDYNAVEGLNLATEYAYDVYGNIRKIKDPNGEETAYTYNQLNLLTRTVSPLGHVTVLAYNPNKKLTRIEREIAGPNQVSSFTYDLLNHLKTSTDPLDYMTHYGYTKNGEPNIVTDAENHSITSVFNERALPVQLFDANDDPTTYTYTPNGDANDVQDAKNNKTRYEYDKFGRLLRTTYPDNSYETFTYDKNSSVTSRTKRNGDIINYEYDALRRLRVKTRPAEPNIVYTYDIAGRVYDVNDAGNITEYYYDRIGRLVDVNDPANRLVSYEYDSRGLRTKLIYPDNSFITYEYDAEGKLRRIRNDSNDVLAEYSYDDLSRRTLLTLGNDANVVYEYDLANRLTKLTNHLADPNTLAFAYDNYDHVGNRLSLKIDDANEQAYAYDSVYRLTYVDYNDGNDTSFYYDALGNRWRTVNGGTVNYQTNNLNQYTSVAGTSYTYDDNGNLAFDGQFRYYYDCESRLIDINDANDAPVASYAYDYLGRRISRTIYGSPDVTIQYAYDGDRIIAEHDGSGTLLRKFIYGPGIDEPICLLEVAENNAVYYYHFDGLGSVVALSDVNSVLVERYTYDVFGRPAIRDANGTETGASAFANPYLFTGRAYDAETGLYYYRARYYDYATGRFLQPDPMGYMAGLNLYTYCGNNALNYVDPSGEFWGGVLGGAIGGVIGGIRGGIYGGFSGAISGAVGGAVAGGLMGLGLPPVVARAAGGAAGAALNAAMNGRLMSWQGLASIAWGAGGGAVMGSLFPNNSTLARIGVGIFSGSGSIMGQAAITTLESGLKSCGTKISDIGVDENGFPGGIYRRN